DAIPADPKRWLLQQFQTFEPRPQALAQVPARTKVVAQLADYLQAQQMFAKAKRPLQQASMPMPASPQSMQPAPAADPQADPIKRYLRQTIRDDYLVMNAAR